MFLFRLLCANALWWAALASVLPAAPTGDANCDGRVNDADVAALTLGVFEGTTCARADVNGDRRVTAGDLPVLLTVLAAPAPSPTPVPTATATASPAGTATRTPVPTTPGGDTPTVTPIPSATPPPTLPSCPPAGAALTIQLDNPAGAAQVVVAVSGRRVVASCQAAQDLAVAYDSDPAEVPTRRSGLAPGAWVHTVRVQTPATGQVQHREALLVAGSADNEVRFTVFPAVATVRTTADAVGVDSLRDALAAAATAPKPFLIQFAEAAFPSGAPTAITLTGALPRLAADDVTIDGVDATGAAGTRVIDAAGLDIPALAIGGARNRLVGLGLRNAGTSNRDVVSINGAAAWGNRIERCTIVHAATGDGIGIDDGAGADFDATANVVIDSEISGASDKGIKVTTNAYARIEHSKVHDNGNGGIQATLGGHLLARDNVVEANAGATDTARNGIAANGGGGTITEVQTDGNIVRANGANGIAVLGASTARLANDYVAANLTAGLRVYNRGADAASAVVEGLTAVCNGTDGAAVEDTSYADFGGPTSSGSNAFAQNARTGNGNNFRNATGAPLLALNNQWEHCGRTNVCDDNLVAAYDIDDHGVWTQFVPAQAHRSGLAPALDAARPAVVRAGELLRVFGTGFNVIDAHAGDASCPDVASRNRCVPLRGNCVLIGGVAAAVEAVTPTMLVVRMPFTCVEPVAVTVQIQGGGTSAALTLCAQPDGAGATTDAQPGLLSMQELAP